MEDKLVHKLVELGYEPQKREKAVHANLIAISRGYLGGLVFFEGEVTALDKCRTNLRDDEIIVTGSRTENSNSLYGDIFKNTLEKDTVVDPRSGYFSSLYIRSLHRKEECICLDFICPQDTISFHGVQNRFTLVFEDIRKKRIASFGFWAKWEMLYVPKRES